MSVSEGQKSVKRPRDRKGPGIDGPHAEVMTCEGGNLVTSL